MMENLYLETIKEHSTLICTPLYGGSAQSQYVWSMFSLLQFTAKHGLPVEALTYGGDSLVTRARNNMTHMFLETKSDYLLWIDGDVGFEHLDVLYAIQLMALEPDKKIICAPYPKKLFNWNLLKDAIDLGRVNSVEDYEKYTGTYGLNFAEDIAKFEINEPVRVAEASTGFMLIHREVFEKFKETYPDKEYTCEGTCHPIATKKFDFWGCGKHPENDRYLSEDYLFCYYARKMGYDVWLLPWMKLTHSGNHMFKGSFKDGAEITTLKFADKED